jgi:hypothetical protein
MTPRLFEPAIVSITVQPANHYPIADSKSIQTLQDQSVAVSLTGSDEDGDALTFSILSSPAHGTLTGIAPNLTYTPTAGYYGLDSFAYRAKDGQVSSAPAIISITVSPLNRTPIASSKSIQTVEDQPVAVLLSGSGCGRRRFGVQRRQRPKSRDTQRRHNLTYTPAAGYYRIDSFTYTARDAGKFHASHGQHYRASM